MGAFHPGPTESPTAVANWLFVRLVAIATGAVFVGYVASTMVGPFSPWVPVTTVALGLVAGWLALQLLFAAIEGYLEAHGSLEG